MKLRMKWHDAGRNAGLVGGNGVEKMKQLSRGRGRRCCVVVTQVCAPKKNARIAVIDSTLKKQSVVRAQNKVVTMQSKRIILP